MNLPLLSYETADPNKFVSFWSRFYGYPIEELYVSRICKKHFSQDDIVQLFVWKNGSRLSQKKHKALQEIISKIEVINKLKSKFSLEVFLEEFKSVKGVIWKTYLLHIITPIKYPIFDQHVCRAYYYISKNQRKEIPTRNIDKERVYFDEYVNFFNELSKGVSKKKLDEALWAFGKFLKSNYGTTLC